MKSPKATRLLKFFALFIAVVAVAGGAFFYYQHYMAPKLYLESLPFEELTTINNNTFSGKLLGSEWIITTQNSQGILAESVTIEHIVAQSELSELDTPQLIKLFANPLFKEAKIEWQGLESSSFTMLPKELKCTQSTSNSIITYEFTPQGDITICSGEFIQSPASSVKFMPIPKALANGAISGKLTYTDGNLNGSGQIFSNQDMLSLKGTNLLIQSGSKFEIKNSELTIQTIQAVTLKLNNQPTTASADTQIKIIDNQPQALFFTELVFTQDNMKIVLHNVTNNQNHLEAESAEWQLFDNSFSSGKVVINNIETSTTAELSNIVQKNSISELKISSAKLNLATTTLFFATANLQQTRESLQLTGAPEGSARFADKGIIVSNIDAKLSSDTELKDMTLNITPNATDATFKSLVENSVANGDIKMQMVTGDKLNIQATELKISNQHQQTTLSNFAGELNLADGKLNYQTGVNSSMEITGLQALKLYNAEINQAFSGHADIALLTPFNDSVVLKNLQLSKENNQLLAKNSLDTTVITVSEDMDSLDFKLSNQTSVEPTLNMGNISLSDGDWAIEAKVGKNYYFKLNADCSVKYRTINFNQLKTACQLTLSEAGAKLEPEFKAEATSARFGWINLNEIKATYNFTPQIFDAEQSSTQIADALHINSFTAKTLGGTITMLNNGRFYAENLDLESFCNEFLNLRNSQASGTVSGMVEVSSNNQNSLRFAPSTLATYPAETGNVKLKNLPLSNQDEIMTSLTSAALADFNYNYIRVDIMDRRVIFTAQGTPVKPLPFVIDTATGEFQKTNNDDLFYMDEMTIEIEFEL